MKDTSELENVVNDVYLDLLSAKSVLQLVLESLEPSAISAKGAMCECLKAQMVDLYIPALHSIFGNIAHAYQRVGEIV